MKRIAIIGSGVSGLTAARLLSDQFDVTVFEKEQRTGGLVRCERIGGALFHVCGGHIFNSKRQDVLAFFWSLFDKEVEFISAQRNSVISFADGSFVPYPIENYIYLLDESVQRSVIRDIFHKEVDMVSNCCGSFQQFLLERFGRTLYELYFKPYNEKIWRMPLDRVSLDWLAGKLPMPTPEEIVFNNFNHLSENNFVHSSFFYEKFGGSQLIIDRLVQGLKLRLGVKVERMDYQSEKWIICDEPFDFVVFCGNIKELPTMIDGVAIAGWTSAINALSSHGTTTVFCQVDANPYSWIYLPDASCSAHRIICTGNFSSSNNSKRYPMTASVEFTDEVELEDIQHALKQMPFHPKYITHVYHPYTYPIQRTGDREMLRDIKEYLSLHGLYLVGRFAEWEYFNMDMAMASAMDTVRVIKNREKSC